MGTALPVAATRDVHRYVGRLARRHPRAIWGATALHVCAALAALGRGAGLARRVRRRWPGVAVVITSGRGCPEEDLGDALFLPMGKSNGRLSLIVHDPMDLELQDMLRFRLNVELDAKLSSRSAIRGFIENKIGRPKMVAEGGRRSGLDGGSAASARSSNTRMPTPVA